MAAADAHLRDAWKQSFNGAVIFRPRKAFAMSVGLPDLVPRLQWGRDLSTTESTPQYLTKSVLPSGFNGAVIFRPRKAMRTLLRQRTVALLQWGRDLSTTERIDAYHSRVNNRTLQWGRDLSTTESHELPREDCRAYAVLQWGRDLSTLESPPTARLMPRSPIRASMGP